MAENKGSSVGVTRKGIVVKDQGFVPYNNAKEEATPDVAKSSSTMGRTYVGALKLRGHWSRCLGRWCFN